MLRHMHLQTDVFQCATGWIFLSSPNADSCPLGADKNVLQFYTWCRQWKTIFFIFVPASLTATEHLRHARKTMRAAGSRNPRLRYCWKRWTGKRGSWKSVFRFSSRLVRAAAERVFSPCRFNWAVWRGIFVSLSEAQSAFGDGACYIEKFIHPVKHIEMQLLCDKYGNIVCLGERECSVQRKNQKMIEESPSPGSWWENP